MASYNGFIIYQAMLGHLQFLNLVSEKLTNIPTLSVYEYEITAITIL